MAYAPRTKVDVDETRYEIERLLKRYGATNFSYAEDEATNRAAIMFKCHDRFVRFGLVLPSAADKEHRRNSQSATNKAVNQARKSRWRALLMCVHAKLESIESKIETFEEAFLAHVVTPDGPTVGEWLRPQLKVAYDSGAMPKQLLTLPAPEGK